MDAWVEVFGTVIDGKKVLTTNNQSLVVSILSAGTFFGALLAGPCGDALGRRWGIVAACAVFCVGIGLQLSLNWAAFVVGRVIAGLGVGLISCLAPMYQSETSPKAWRGLVMGLYQWSITIGILLSSIVNNFMSTRTDNSGWMSVISIQFAWAAIMVGGMIYLPETPRHLCTKGRHDRAKAALARITALSGEELEQEYQILREGLEAEAPVTASSYRELFSRGEQRMWLRTLTGVLIQACQQLTGINFIFYFGTVFFKSSGVSNPFVISIITNVVNVVCTIPGILVIDKIGRRSLLFWAAIAMSVCEFIVAAVGMTEGQVAADGTVNLVAQRVLIAFICLYIAAFAAFWGPIPWVVCAEVFPSRLRAKGMSLAVASNWLWNFAIGYATPYLVNKSTPEMKTAGLGVKVFLIWGSTCAGCALFTFFFVAETKGLSLEQVDELYKNSSIVRSNAYRKVILAQQKHAEDMPISQMGYTGETKEDLTQQFEVSKA
jgi:sugar porter (SP) family MFS transporter